MVRPRREHFTWAKVIASRIPADIEELLVKEAKKRRLSRGVLVRDIVIAVVEDNLFTAVLDD